MAGLVELARAKPLLREYRRNGFVHDIIYDVPSAFVVPAGAGASRDALKRPYFSLMGEGRALCAIIMDDAVNKVPLVYNSQNADQSFEEFADALQEMRDTSGKPVVVQRIDGAVSSIQQSAGPLVRIPLDKTPLYLSLAQTLEKQTPAGWQGLYDVELVAAPQRNAVPWRDILSPFPSAGTKESRAQQLKARVEYALRQLECERVPKEFAALEILPAGRKPSPRETQVIGYDNTRFIARSSADGALLKVCYGVTPAPLDAGEGIALEYADKGFEENTGTFSQQMQEVFDVRGGNIIPVACDRHLLKPIFDPCFDQNVRCGSTVPSEIQEKLGRIVHAAGYFANQSGAPVTLHGFTAPSGKSHKLYFSRLAQPEAEFAPLAQAAYR
jgi:hypothetical protein